MKKLFILIGLTAALISCQKTFIYHPVYINNGNEWMKPYVPQNNDGDYGIVFGNYNAATKASVASISTNGYDDFTLYTWNSLNDTIMNPYTVQAIGANAYSYENVGSQELKYFKNAATNYEFIGVIPTNKTSKISNGTVIVEGVSSAVVDDNRVLGNLTADSPEEFLYTYANIGKANYSTPVNLQFNHGNSVVYLGFTSDRNDTKLLDYVPGIPATPAQSDTTDTWINLKNGNNTIATSTQTKAPGSTNYVNALALPDNLVAEIKSYYSVDGSAAGNYELKLGKSAWDPINGNTNLLKKLRVVKDIPAAYKKTVDMHGEGIMVDFFDAIKYLNDNGYYITSGTTGGKPAVFSDGYIILDAYVNGSAYTVVALNYGESNSVPQYTIVDIPATQGTPGLEGIRVFSAKVVNESYVHEGHTSTANANVSYSGLMWSNIVNVTDMIQFSLPVNATLSNVENYSPSTFYAIPANPNITHFVVKLSYDYNGVKVYDVRVPIQLPTGGLLPGKYYKYIINITSIGNGGTDPNQADTDKDDIDVVADPVITISASFTDYTLGEEKTITI